MSTYTPLDLLRRWQQEDLTADQAIGHVLQIILAQQQMLQAQQQRLRTLEQRLATDEPEAGPSSITAQRSRPRRT